MLPGVVASLVKAKSDPRKDPTFKEADDAHKKLIEAWNIDPKLRDMNSVGHLLEQAKLKLANMKFFLPSSGKNAPHYNLLLARDVLEVGAFYSIAKATPDTKMFERYMSQLKTYYIDYDSVLQDRTANVQSRKYELLTVNLLFLLTEGRTAEFHTELELILNPSEDSKKILENEFVSRAVQIGQSLQEGRYNTVCQTRGSEIKSQACQYFISKLIESSRDEIAETLEKAYTRLSKKLAYERLHFTDDRELLTFAHKRGWTLDDKYFSFNLVADENATVPAKRIIFETLGYAKELEKIV